MAEETPVATPPQVVTHHFARYPTPIPKTADYPLITGLALEAILVMILLFISRRYDATGGSLTISLMIVTAFLGLTIYASLFTVPQDEETATIVGGLVAAFGAVVAYWVSRRPPNGAP